MACSKLVLEFIKQNSKSQKKKKKITQVYFLKIFLWKRGPTHSCIWSYV